jgi:hypothetical protein
LRKTNETLRVIFVVRKNELRSYSHVMTKKSNISRPSTHLSLLAAPLLGLMATSAHSAALAIANAGFETDSAPIAGATGWTVTTTGGYGFFTTTTGAPDSAVDPDNAFEGVNWLSGNRLATGQATSGNAGAQRINQLIDISGDAALIDSGAVVDLSFRFADNDGNDSGFVTINYFSDVSGTTPIGSALTTGTLPEAGGGFNLPATWQAGSLSGTVPVGARSLSIVVGIDRISGSAGNVHFDDFSGAIAVPEPSAALLGLLGAFGLVRRRR